MANASTRLALAVLALAVIWIVAYWRTEAPAPKPSVAFGEPPVDVAEPPPTDELELVELPPPQAARVEEIPAPAPPRVDPSPAPGGTIPPQFREHVVAKGDTAETISRRYYGTPTRWDAVMRANPRIDFERLRAGTVIKVAVDPDNIQGVPAPTAGAEKPEEAAHPQPIEYLVKPGDTLSEIAKAVYGRSSLWTVIRDANIDKVGRDGSRLRAGTTIVIPPLTGAGR